MSLVADVSVNTLIISGVVGLCTFLMKGTGHALVTLGKELVMTLTRTIVKVETLDKELTKLIAAVGDVQKIRSDLNEFYARLKKLEDERKL